MSDVKRYTLTTGIPAGAASLKAGSIVVAVSDYDALLAERDLLRAELEHREILLEETRLAWDMALKASEHLRAEVAMLRSYEGEWERSLNQLRAELEAIRGQQAVAWVSPDAAGGVRWSPGALQQLSDGSPLYALPPQHPDAVSVPRELLRRLLDSNNRNTFCAGTYLKAHDELSALLSTKNAEEV